MVIYLCLKIYFPIDHNCKIQSEFSDILEKGRIACTSPAVQMLLCCLLLSELSVLLFSTCRKYIHGVTLGAVGFGTLLAIPMNLLVARRVNKEGDDNTDGNSKDGTSGQNVESWEN